MKWQTIVETPEFLKIAEKFGDRDVIDDETENGLKTFVKSLVKAYKEER